VNVGKLDLSSLPKFRDGTSFLYIDRTKVDRDEMGIRLLCEDGELRFPCAQVSVLMLGPGTSITHSAVMELAKFGCLLLWVGEQGVRFYASGYGETRNAKNLERQAMLWALPQSRIEIAKRMYRLRFSENPPETATLEILRGMEGKRIQYAYAAAAERFGIQWNGRSYDSEDWNSSDTPNRALSVANTCLYGVCHAGITSFGFTGALGFVHTGRMASFVYDVADFYKVEMALPVAFEEASKGPHDLERRVRIRLREQFRSGDLLIRIERDVFSVLGLGKYREELEPPTHLLHDNSRSVEGAVNYGSRAFP
jgi:CRISPR-associated protein Cas1